MGSPERKLARQAKRRVAASSKPEMGRVVRFGSDEEAYERLAVDLGIPADEVARSIAKHEAAGTMRRLGPGSWWLASSAAA